jgi:nitroimidazol reductase NimA-like FMN-containing flavoprotein (pyridoxamine 5'-phosphate oxidase superfamily)
LSTVEEPYPYAVPVVYGYDGEYFYVANKSGRKVSNIEANRSVCLCVADVQQGPGDWSSVVATGDAEFIASGDGRLEALRALRRQMGYEIDVGPRDLARIAAARVIRIVPHEITGRTTAER